MKYTHNYMKIFLDTADTEVINEYFKTGLVDGVTTNPTLIMKSGRNPMDVYQDIKDIGVRDISMEVVGSAAQMYHEGRRLSDMFGDVCTVKLPMTRDGLSVCKELSDMNVKVNVTLIFCAAQAVLAAKAGATYVSPFIGRIDDTGHDGMELIAEIMNTWANYDIDTKVLAASIRHPTHVLQCIQLGAHTATMPAKTFRQLMSHPLTDKGLEGFMRDWAEVEAAGNA